MASQQGGGVTGWDLLATLREQAAYQEFYDTAQPTACPRCGEPLREGPPNESGILFCRFDGWQYPRDYDVTTMSGM
jgi:hypothetical protein